MCLLYAAYRLLKNEKVIVMDLSMLIAIINGRIGIFVLFMIYFLKYFK